MTKARQSLLALIADGEFHSGQQLSAQLDVSRAAIWKSIQQLRESGLGIESRRGRGYRLEHKIQLLDAGAIRQALTKAAGQYCRDIEILFETESTNKYLSDCLQQGPCSGKVVLSEYQSHGKGRRGHQWLSPLASGLYLSLAWRTDKPYAALGLLSLFIGVAIARSMTELGIKGIGLKWPNDILIDNRKLGGVLVEMQGEANGPIDIIVGVGINYEFPPHCRAGIDQPVTDMAEHLPEAVSRNEAAASLISHLFSLLAAAGDEQRNDLLAEWRHYDCYKGRKARLILSDEEINGQLEGVDEEGCLLMSVNGKLQRYTCGEVSLRVAS